MSKLKFVSNLIVLVLLITAGTARATCITGGKVSRLRSGLFGDVVDIAPSGNLPAFAVFYTVLIGTTDRFYSMLAAAQAGNVFVFVTGDATSCPTSGTFRAGGDVISVDMLKNQ